MLTSPGVENYKSQTLKNMNFGEMYGNKENNNLSIKFEIFTKNNQF